ncbi:HVA22-like protein [Drosera capensis]
MIGSLITRGLVMIFGYAYPAYMCFKVVEKNKPEVEQLRFWCQYWILVALLTVFERIGDTFISWVPMYSEAKLAFYVYLWYPKTMGTQYVYDSFFRPYIAMHETEIDRNLSELKIRAGDIAVQYWQKAATYSQIRFFDILQYVAAQSTPSPRPTQAPQQTPRSRQPAAAAAANRQPPTIPKPRAQPQTEEPSPSSTASTSQHQEIEQEASSSQTPSTAPAPAAPPPPVLNATKKTAPSPIPPSPSLLKKTLSAPESSNQLGDKEAEDMMQIESVPPQAQNDNPAPPSQETVIEEAIPVTRGRLRKARSGGK